MSGAHGTLGWLTLGVAGVVALLALLAWLAGPGRLGRVLGLITTILVIVVTALVAVVLFLGGLLLMTGLRPQDVVHVLLGIAALATLPVSLAVGAWSDRGESQRRYLWVCGGSLLLMLLAFLLGQTG